MIFSPRKKARPQPRSGRVGGYCKDGSKLFFFLLKTLYFTQCPVVLDLEPSFHCSLSPLGSLFFSPKKNVFQSCSIRIIFVSKLKCLKIPSFLKIHVNSVPVFYVLSSRYDTSSKLPLPPLYHQFTSSTLHVNYLLNLFF